MDLKDICSVLLTFCASVFMTVFGLVAQRINLSAFQICENMAVLSYEFDSFQNPLDCRLLYWNGDSENNNIKNVTLISHRKISLDGLKLNNKYEVKIECSETLYSNKIQFTTRICHDSSKGSVHSTTTKDGPVVLYKEREIISSSTLDIVLGIIFAVAALAILAVAMYYYYRRYQRNQRLQRFYSTPHTDPFENLQDYIEGAS